MSEKASDPHEQSDAAVRGKYHFLDVGAEKYGDCILVEFGRVRVLIDGSHEKDFAGQEGYLSVPDQLSQLFPNEQRPYRITVMVVTHCHKDHVGALPKLVSEGVIDPEWALLTDPKLGFGRSQDDSDAVDLSDERTRKLAAALREEDASDLTDSALSEFMDAAATVEAKYAAMLADLEDKGVRIVRYRGQKLPPALVAATRASGMQLLGPSQDQLVLAAEQISQTNKDATDAVQSALAQDSALSDVALYRALSGSGLSDAGGGRGDAMNCQSITLAFGPRNARALLAGDMQFAQPGVRGADAEVAALRTAVATAGPYKLFKTTHHTAHNGQDDDLLEELGDPPIIIHTGGSNDASHPYPTTLQMLKRRARSIVFARTDRNGLITVEPHRAPEDAVTVSRGRINNFTDNASDVNVPAPPVEVRVAAARASTTGSQVIIVNLPAGSVDMSVAGVDIVVRSTPTAPPLAARPDVPVDLPARTAPVRTPRTGPVVLAGGRALPKLLFVTDRARLAANIGQQEAAAAVDAIRAARQSLFEVSGSATGIADAVRARLQSQADITGVVILGGYDVVPSMVVDVLPPKLRNQLGEELTQRDSDDFFVWSDEYFGDMDGDHVGERPVSRIPDGRDAGLLLTALQAKSAAPQERFGVRNIARPFAESIWTDLPGRRALNASRDYLSAHASAPETEAGCQYFMLHGSDVDASVFSGEDGSIYTRAFTIQNVPPTFSGLVFSGCCWGALSVSQKAVEIGDRPPAPRIAERSIALSYLKAGANAFVGCTGAHYSGPDTDPDVNYALPLHSAFWKALPNVGYSASLALYGARRYYGELIASDTTRRNPLDIARRLKNRAQFTCLGLGW